MMSPVKFARSSGAVAQSRSPYGEHRLEIEVQVEEGVPRNDDDVVVPFQPLPESSTTAARLSCHGIRQTFEGSFSAASKPNFASKYAFESSPRDLHNASLCSAFGILFFLFFARSGRTILPGNSKRSGRLSATN